MENKLTKEDYDRAYAEGSPLISDAEYDRRFKPETVSDLPISGAKETQPRPIIGIDAKKIYAELPEDVSDYALVLPKYDGISAMLRIKDKKIVEKYTGVFRKEGFPITATFTPEPEFDTPDGWYPVEIVPTIVSGLYRQAVLPLLKGGIVDSDFIRFHGTYIPEGTNQLMFVRSYLLDE